MKRDSLFYKLSYRFGSPHWDTDEPRAELEEIIAGRPPGRALDLGCGTGSNAVYLAKQGWEAVGIDFVPSAIARAKERALAIRARANFVTGDVTDLRQAGVVGTFDLVIDIGCYHTIPARLRAAYEAQVAGVARSGAEFYLAGISHPPASWRLLGARGVDTTELTGRFSADFDLADERPLGTIGRASNFVLYHMVRKPTRMLDPTNGSQGSCA